MAVLFFCPSHCFFFFFISYPVLQNVVSLSSTAADDYKVGEAAGRSTSRKWLRALWFLICFPDDCLQHQLTRNRPTKLYCIWADRKSWAPESGPVIWAFAASVGGGSSLTLACSANSVVVHPFTSPSWVAAFSLWSKALSASSYSSSFSSDIPIHMQVLAEQH